MTKDESRVNQEYKATVKTSRKTRKEIKAWTATSLPLPLKELSAIKEN
jgi:hypothetical protein